MADETCRQYEVDGEPVVVRGGKPLDEQDQAALAELVHAAKEHVARVNPHGDVVQELIAAVRLAVACIPDGMIRTDFLGGRDGAEVKQRLKDAAAAVRAALRQETTMADLGFVTRVLKAFEFDNTDSLWWNFVDSKLHLFAQCSDFFEWGTADLEEILPEDIDLLEQSVTDVTELDRTNMYAGELFAARKRKLRPQGACYKNLPEVLWPLFDAAGPARETDLLNPHKHPSQRAEGDHA